MPPSVLPARALRGPWRAVRVGVLGSVSLLLATAAHTAGGGTLPSVGFLVVTAYVLGLIAVPLTARRCRSGVLLAVLSAEQLLLHGLLTTATEPGGCVPTSGGVHHLAMNCLPGGAAAIEAGGSAPIAMDMGGAGMWIGHALATIATVWVLARAEAWLWRAADRVVELATAAPTGAGRHRAARPIAIEITSSVATARFSPATPRGPPIPR